ncbi:hypothetical protein O181_058538 [Austropuccinia psidii MF-1]|uniref:Uncharacterized protein n=1 Tax=Austropuccinia psidii MF-1 TaxID=1389203 RepID=A0A9Q3ED85_9BASI|nr:hypothetical protein [Austropuccinia psidii MF-1]
MQQVLSPSSLKTELVYFICDANLPLSIDKSPAFQALLELCTPAVTKIPNMTAYLAFTAHYIDTDFKRTSINLRLAKIEGEEIVPVQIVLAREILR